MATIKQRRDFRIARNEHGQGNGFVVFHYYHSKLCQPTDTMGIKLTCCMLKIKIIFFVLRYIMCDNFPIVSIACYPIGKNVHL